MTIDEIFKHFQLEDRIRGFGNTLALADLGMKRMNFLVGFVKEVAEKLSEPMVVSDMNLLVAEARRIKILATLIARSIDGERPTAGDLAYVDQHLSRACGEKGKYEA